MYYKTLKSKLTFIQILENHLRKMMSVKTKASNKRKFKNYLFSNHLHLLWLTVFGEELSNFLPVKDKICANMTGSPWVQLTFFDTLQKKENELNSHV